MSNISRENESESLQLNDAVFVDVSSAASGPTSPSSLSSSSSAYANSSSLLQLQGVVAYLGPVHFVKSAVDEWVGVRLTGPSAALGKNDGSVKGVRYFNCGPNGGIFVKRSSVTKRTLTKLEEVRLKRELNKTGPTTTAGASDSSQRQSITPTKEGNSRRSIRTNTDAADTGISPIKNSDKSKQSLPRLSHTGNLELTPTSPRPPMQAEKISSLEKSVKTLNELIVVKDEQIHFLQQRLRQAEETNTLVNEKHTHLETTLQANLKEMDETKEQARNLKQMVEIYKNQQTIESMADIPNPSSPFKGIYSLPTLQQDLIQTQIQLSTLQEKYDSVTSQKDVVEQQLNQTLQDYQIYREKTSHEQYQMHHNMKQIEMNLIQSIGEKNALERQILQQEDQISTQKSSQLEHLKEAVNLQTNISVLHRRILELEKDLIDKDVRIEGLTMEKLQMEELIEILEEKVEELQIDGECAAIEFDELQLEMDELKASSNIHAFVGPSSSEDEQNRSVSSEYDTKQALTIQNIRLRDALARLRDQSIMEKRELQRQLRTAEKDIDTAVTTQEDFTRLVTENQRLREEAESLKEIVDRGTAMEHMVEKLTDRILTLEENKGNLESLVKDLEESIEINNAMEEAQLYEIKALSKDLQYRDSVIINLEEGIKMMKRRESEFQKTIGNYRASIEKLQQEKNALLDIQQDGDGGKINFLAASQKALSYAARLVKELTKSRKRDADLLHDRIAAQMFRHLSDRLESFLPSTVAGSEIVTVKGEIFLASIAHKISIGLSIIDDIGRDLVVKGRAHLKTLNLKAQELIEGSADLFVLTEAQIDAVKIVVKHTRFMKLLISASSPTYRALYAGQWPDLLSIEESMSLGSSIISIMTPLDCNISANLKILIEDGTSPTYPSILTDLEHNIKNTVSSLNQLLAGNTGRAILPESWDPVSLQLYCDLTYSRLLCICSAAFVAAVVLHVLEDGNAEHVNFASSIMDAMSVLDIICSESIEINTMLADLDIKYDEVIDELMQMVRHWKNCSLEMSDTLESVLSKPTSTRSDLAKIYSSIAAVHKSITKVAAYCRALNLNIDGTNSVHPLSPENKDPWKNMTNILKRLNDAENLNYIKRASALQNQVNSALENDSKLIRTEAIIRQLEKKLITKGKEISMQNDRIGELELLLMQVTSAADARGNEPTSSFEEMFKLREENRYLSDAVQILQQQLDDYENEAISQKGRGKNNKTQERRASNTDFPIDLSFDSVFFDKQVLSESRVSLEAALFRPALFTATSISSVNKFRQLHDMVSELPALEVIMRAPEELQEISKCSSHLSQARNRIRSLKASIQLVKYPDALPSYRDIRTIVSIDRDSVSLAIRKLEESSSSARHLVSLLENSNSMSMHSSNRRLSPFHQSDQVLGNFPTMGQLTKIY